MAWREFDTRSYGVHRGLEPEQTARLRTNDVCFLRRQHRCGKVFSASKSCFVACPTDDSLEPLLALLEAKLAAHGIEAVIAVKERAYGQDIVCTKICGRIIESRFCVAILDETDRSGVSVANPNVYYEYGLMTALRKHIIPLQREGYPLAFNIQSQDTVKYTPKNMAEELERAIRDAIAITEPGKKHEDSIDLITTQRILRHLELSGYKHYDSDSPVTETTRDTQFMTFISNSGFLFLAKVDNDKDMQTCQDDIPVLVHRLKEIKRHAEEELAELPKTIETITQELNDPEKEKVYGYTYRYEREQALLREERKKPILEKRVRFLSGAYFGIVSAQGLTCELLHAQISLALADTSLTPIWNEGPLLRIGDTKVVLNTTPTAFCQAPDTNSEQ